jgi:adenylate cyclase
MGARNLFHLLTEKYHRPVLEQRIFLFLDIKGSTALVERLGPIETRSLISKLLFDTSVVVTDHDGEIHRFTGDGFVAVWDWELGIENNQIVHAIGAIGAAVRSDAEYYLSKLAMCLSSALELMEGLLLQVKREIANVLLGSMGTPFISPLAWSRKQKS